MVKLAPQISKVIWLYLAARDLQRLNGGNGTSPQEYKKPIVITFQGEKEGGVKVHAYPQYMDKNNLVPFEIVGAHQEIHQACRLLEKTYGTFYHKAHCATLQDVITNWNGTNKDEESSSPTPSAVTASPETVQSDAASVISEYDGYFWRRRGDNIPFGSSGPIGTCQAYQCSRRKRQQDEGERQSFTRLLVEPHS